MLVPHSTRSVWGPITLVVTLTLLYSALPLYRVFSNFYTLTVLVDELSRILGWRFSLLGLQLVCIGGACYLLSRMGKFQLNRSEDLPQPMTLDIKRILGLTMFVAIAFAAARWSDSNEPARALGRQDLMFTLSSISYLWLGIAWACLSWASALRSVKWAALTIGALVLCGVGSGYIVYWLLRNDPISILEPDILLSASHSLLSSLAILAAIRIVRYCGYNLSFAP